MTLFYSSDSLNMIQQDQDPETEAAKWNSAIITLIKNTCDFPIGYIQMSTLWACRQCPQIFQLYIP